MIAVKTTAFAFYIWWISYGNFGAHSNTASAPEEEGLCWHLPPRDQSPDPNQITPYSCTAL